MHPSTAPDPHLQDDGTVGSLGHTSEARTSSKLRSHHVPASLLPHPSSANVDLLSQPTSGAPTNSKEIIPILLLRDWDPPENTSTLLHTLPPAAQQHTPPLSIASTPSPNFIQPPHRLSRPENPGGHSGSHCSILLSSDSVGHSCSSSSVNAPSYLTPGQASLFQALFSLAEPIESSRDSLVPDALQGPSISCVLTIPSAGQVHEGQDIMPNEDGYVEGLRQPMRINPTLDPNTVDNALPFVLASLAQWISSDFFDGSAVVHPFKEVTFERFRRSPEARARVILVANVVSTLSKNSRQNARSMAIATSLQNEAYDSIAHFYSIQPNPQHELDVLNAMRAVNSVMEVILIWRFSSPIFTIIKLMEAIAPVFRRACPEPIDRLVNLPTHCVGLEPMVPGLSRL
ncbi:hypothetical protein RSAG8_12663, partial [Rhizoctonia solani AG-8 WAC10335]